MSPMQPSAVIVLAAGEGTRMRSAKPKVLHEIAGRSLIHHVVSTAQAAQAGRIAVVVRHRRDLVVEHVEEFADNVLFADQDDVPGTGRAAQCALAILDAAAQADAAAQTDATASGDLAAVSETVVHGPVVVVSGDVPMLDSGTLTALVNAHTESDNAITILSTELADAAGYGRIVRDGATGQVQAIVEDKDATEEQRAIREINGGVYVFDADVLRDGLGRITRDNAQQELYLPDVVGLAVTDQRPVRAIRTDDPWLVAGINDRIQLAAMAAEINRRLLEDAMAAGVTVVDPATTWIDVDVDLDRDVTLLPGVQLHGVTSVGSGSVIGPDTTLTDVEIGENATVIRTHGSLAVIGDNAIVGPFSYLRPGTKLGVKGKIGAFVEVKNAEIGAGAKVPHLSYVGDATIGEQTNIGAGTIFANFDGVNKHRTSVGSFARTGSDNIFVAPITIGDGAYTGAGTTVRHDVPPGALALSGGSQRIVPEWVLRQRAGTPAAEAAAAALAEHPDAESGLSPQARAEQSRGQQA